MLDSVLFFAAAAFVPPRLPLLPAELTQKTTASVFYTTAFIETITTGWPCDDADAPTRRAQCTARGGVHSQKIECTARGGEVRRKAARDAESDGAL